MRKFLRWKISAAAKSGKVRLMMTDAMVNLTIFRMESQKVESVTNWVKLSSPMNCLMLAPFQLKKL